MEQQIQPSLAKMALGYITAEILYVAAELRLADAFDGGPRSYQELAKETGADPRTLRRLLRALVGEGVVTQVDADRFALTELGGQLRADAPDSVRDTVLLTKTPELHRAWGQLLSVVRRGEPTLHPDTGKTPFEWLLDNEELAPKFHRLMGESTRALAPGITRAGDFGRFGTVADIGGGDGTLLAGILAEVPGPRGVLYDLATAMETAPAILSEAGVADRCEIVGGDFFSSVPSGADAYLLKNVIHDWDDEKSVAVLRNCRAAMGPDARLLLVETVLPTIMTKDNVIAFADLGIMVGCGGAERSEEEYRELFDASGFTFTSITEVLADGQPTGFHVVEGTPTA
ncbi:methyltransferase [Streptomyces flavofungini]|uniref:O-methyltransferase n=1 Tax=Streptomyces flavofungini TaxID=68200 RepID=A0ABS0X4F8_9ACTN|nr:methyltransferase [Streptomyces flavofungini]MBJ3808072.1 hypothetical protein [Streptomyces flavofungini]GHC83270.1 hydroxyneurosporene-O-methyltransferase [Streptomyces flavofungini]